MSEPRIFYQLRCNGFRESFNEKASIFSQTIYNSKERAEKDIEKFRENCINSNGVSRMFDLEDTPKTVVHVIELILKE